MTDPARQGYGRDVPPGAGDQNSLNRHMLESGTTTAGRINGALTAASVFALFVLAGVILWEAPDGDSVDETGRINMEATVMDNVQEPVPAVPTAEPARD
ncbi:hypothetical protein [Hoeflea sp.]|uniref:hypothetical protein n=1 Tax=Hoeflea sp. TaxID=1940281 RepID=UPI003B523D9C